MPALSVHDLSYRFGDNVALEHVSFAVEEGAFTLLLGPNGAGKSTLFNLITRLYDTEDGNIAVFGHDVSRQSRQALAAMGVVFQQPTLDLDLTVMQNLLYHGALHGLSVTEARRRAEEELSRLRMQERQAEKVRTLNGGHRRRVEIARALLHRPRLLLLDEPTVGLDVPTRRAIVEHVHGLARDERLAVLWATHLIDEVADDDRLLVLHRGRLRADGGVPEVLAAAGVDSVEAAFDTLTARATA